MKITVFAQFAGSPGHGMVYGHYFLAREWVNMGHEVTIVAASFSHTRFVQPDTPRLTSSKETLAGGVRYVWLPGPRYQAGSNIGRGFAILVYTLCCLLYVLAKRQADVVIASSHHPFAILPARLLAARTRSRLVYEIRDLWPLTLIEVGGISRFHPFIVAMQAAEDLALNTSDRVVSVLPRANEYLQTRGMEPSKFAYVPNGADLSPSEQMGSLPNAHARLVSDLRRKRAFLVGYAGSLNRGNQPHVLVDAIAAVATKRVHGIFLGGGPEREALEARAIELGVRAQIHFLEPVAKSVVPAFLTSIDAAFLGTAPSRLYRYGTSLTKINDYLLSHLPVICAIDGDVEAIRESGAGLLCKPGDPESVAKAIAQLMATPTAERVEMGRKGAEWVRQHRDYRVLAGQFLQYATV